MSTTHTIAVCTFRDGKPVVLPLADLRSDYAAATAVLRAAYRREAQATPQDQTGEEK